MIARGGTPMFIRLPALMAATPVMVALACEPAMAAEFATNEEAIASNSYGAGFQLILSNRLLHREVP
jgi:hypothetical protein